MPLIKGEDNRDEAEYIGGIVKRIGNFDPDKFEESIEHRKQFQKTVYLVQAFDIDLGYSFSWYIYGVYSPDLADVGYELAEIYEYVTETQFADPDVETKFQSFLDFIEPLKNDVTKLEITSSLHFVRERNPDLDRDLLITWLLDEKDLDATVEDCEEEWFYLEDNGLV